MLSRGAVKSAVFVVGFVLESIGLFIVFASGMVLKAIVWILAGVCLQIAGGALSESGQRGRLANPLVVLGNELRSIRQRIQGWDRRA